MARVGRPLQFSHVIFRAKGLCLSILYGTLSTGSYADAAPWGGVVDERERMIPKVVHFVWLGSEPPANLLATITRIRELEPEWEVKLWHDEDLDWLENRRWFDASPTYAGRANIARYEILARHGGLYVDADFEFLQSPASLDLGSSGLVLSPEESIGFNNAFIASSPGHPFLRRLVDRVGASIERNVHQPTWVASGPAFVTSEYLAWSEESGEKASTIPRDVLYPYYLDKLNRGDGPWSPQVVAVHRWDQSRSGRAWVGSHSGLRSLPLRVRYRTNWIIDRVRPRYRLRQFGLWIRRWRWRSNAFAIGEGRAFTVLRSGRPIVFDSEDTIQLRYLVVEGRFDDGYRRFLAATLSGSDVYVDVGANIGQFVVEAMRHVSRLGRVLAFEPNPRLAEILRKNVMLHRNLGALGDVAIAESAVSDRAGTATLHVPRSHAGRGTLLSATVSDVDPKAVDEYSVSVVRLDEVLGHLSHIRLLKIDVEGNEPNVLLGAMDLIESGRVDYIDLEAVRRHLGSRCEVLVDLLSKWEQQGVTFWHITRRGRLKKHERPVSELVTTSDHNHLVVDVRCFGERARARTRR